MKAVVYDKTDPAGVLVYREVEKPVPGDGEVLVKIYNVGINAADYRSIKMGIIPKKKIFGADIAGRVEAAGKNVKKFRIGDEVLGPACGIFRSGSERRLRPEKCGAGKVTWGGTGDRLYEK